MAELISNNYKHEKYFRKDTEKKIKEKMELCYLENKPTIILLIKFESTCIHGKLQPFKEACRTILNKDHKYSKKHRRKFVHMSDKIIDTLDTCKYLF